MQQESTEKTLAGAYWHNSYPWPFCHSEFANWPEFRGKNNYSLVTDRSGCVVKHDTSYIAWKIREITGEWPKRTDLVAFTQFDWIQFLADSGYFELAITPQRNHKYVGIYPSKKDETIAVWYEETTFDKENPIVVTTYLDKKFKILHVEPDKYTWVKIK